MRNVPAMGPAAPKPNAPRINLTKRGNETMPMIAQTTTATNVQTRCKKSVETIIG